MRPPSSDASFRTASFSGTTSTKPASTVVAEIQGHDLSASGTFLRRQEESRADVADDAPVVVEVRNQCARRPVGACQIDDGRRAAARAGRRVDGGIATVVGHAGHMHQMRLLRCRIDGPIVALRGVQRMEEDSVSGHTGLLRRSLRRLGEARIEEARSVLRPGNRGEPRPGDLVVENFAGLDVEHADRAPVRPAVLHCEGEVPAVLGG